MITTILWDFDGVILDSMKVRDWGFVQIFKNFKESQVENLLEFHRLNGGLSRYVKIRYFFENILNKHIEENEINSYAYKFSELMREKLIDKENLIGDSLDFIKINYKNYNFHIVSGSDQGELRFLCKKLKIDKYFNSIHGSPTPKTELVKELIINNDYKFMNTCLIGDSINDFEAATDNNIEFFGYNNNKLRNLHKNYIHSFKDIKI